MRQVLYVRTEGALVQRLEAVAATAREARPGALVSRASVVRELLHASLEDHAMLRRLGLATGDREC